VGVGVDVYSEAKVLKYGMSTGERNERTNCAPGIRGRA